MIELILDPFKYDFMIRSLITAFASGAMLSLLGPFAINRNMGFMADAMAHATLPIIAVGVFLGFSISELGVPAAILIAIFLGIIIQKYKCRRRHSDWNNFLLFFCTRLCSDFIIKCNNKLRGLVIWPNTCCKYI